MGLEDNIEVKVPVGNEKVDVGATTDLEGDCRAGGSDKAEACAEAEDLGGDGHTGTEILVAST